MGRTRKNRAGPTREQYEEAALAVLRGQTPEDIMEATPQATQRKITLCSLELVRGKRPDFQVFNELMVQYPDPDSGDVTRVVPDNMVVLHEKDLGTLQSFDLSVQKARPFWVMEYASKSSESKDEVGSYGKYETSLKVPYYLICYSDNEEMSLFRLDARAKHYGTVLPNEEGRCALPEVGIEVGLVDGWVRFWHEGRLLPLPAELDRELDEMRADRNREKRRADRATRRADRASRRADPIMPCRWPKRRSGGRTARRLWPKKRSGGPTARRLWPKSRSGGPMTRSGGPIMQCRRRKTRSGVRIGWPPECENWASTWRGERMGGTRPSREESMRQRYEQAAEEAIRGQTVEDVMEATPQATQRKITLASLDLVHARRPDFQVFNELMVQYAEPGSEAIRRVVPDNMVVLHEGDLGPLTSLSLPVHAVRPFWVMEYASTSSRRKDDEDNFDKYERILEAPYYLLYYPENEELTLYRFDAERHRYDTVPPGGEGRRALPEVGIEVGLVGGWVRFWHEGRLLLLPAEADRELDEVRAERDRESRRADLEKLRGDRERRRADYWTRLADYWTQRADEAKQQADEEHRRAGQLAAKSRALGIDPDA